MEDLLHFFLQAKPDWTADERRAVFAKLSAIQHLVFNALIGRPRIRDVSGLLRALHASDSLNEQLRAAGQKPFHWRTINALRWRNTLTLCLPRPSQAKRSI